MKLSTFSWVFLFGIPSGTFGWGVTGHDIIAGIMKARLSPQALRYVITHIGDGLDMMDASSWADSDDAKSRYPGSSDLHHSSTPYRDCSSFVMERDCPNGECIVTGIARSALIITDPNVPEKIRKDHFKFFLHFLGDIHQPLHTGFAEDHGGNDIPLSFPTGMSLHEVWDSEILSRMIGGVSDKNIHKLIVDQAEKLRNDIPYRDSMGLSNRGVRMDSMDTIVELASSIASETTTTLTCEHAYVDMSKKYIEANEALSRNYLKANGHIVIEQLTKAAVRAADMIEALAELFYARKREIRAVSHAVLRPQAAQEEPTGAAGLESDNPYAVLFFDFEPEQVFDSIWTPDQVVVLNVSAVVPVRPRQPKKTNPDVFEGVDLTKIVLMRFDDDRSDFALTYRDLAEEHRRQTKYSAVMPRFMSLEFVTIRFENGPKEFGLDRRVFGRNPSKQLIVRCIAYLKGIRLDQSTDISLFISAEETIDETSIGEGDGIIVHPNPDPLVEEIRIRLERKYHDRMRRMEQASKTKGYISFEDMLDKSYDRIITEKFRYCDHNVIFAIHPRTLKQPSIVTRFNAYKITPDVYLVVDPYVRDGPLTDRFVGSIVAPRERAKNGKGFIKERSTDSFMHHIQMYRPTFLEEMKWISMAVWNIPNDNQGRLWCILKHTDAKHDYLVLHYIMHPPLSAFLEHTDLDDPV